MLYINKTKWKIIEELTKGNKTPTELAEKLKIKLPSIHTQLKVLEQEELIKKIGEIKGKTRPYTLYSVGSGFVYFIKVLPDEAEQRFLEIDENLRLHLKIWSIPQVKYHYYIENFWWRIQNYLEDIDAIVVYGSVATGNARDDSDIDILILVKRNTKRYERKFNALMVGPKGKQEMIMTQVFKTDDFMNSLKKGSKFAEGVIKNHKVIYDLDKKFEKIKNELK